MELYAFPPSQPSRAVHMALEYYSLPHNYNPVNLLKGEHMEEKFLTINPRHKIPVLIDGDLVITESRAILGYVAAKAGKEHACPRRRAKVDEALYFDACTFTAAYNGGFVGPVIFGGQDKVDDGAVKSMGAALADLEEMLGKTAFVAGDELTVADLSVLSTYSTLRLLDVVDVKPYAKVAAWFNKVKAMVPNYERINEHGAQAFAELFKSKIA